MLVNLIKNILNYFKCKTRMDRRMYFEKISKRNVLLTFLWSWCSCYRSNDGQKQSTNDQQRFCHFCMFGNICFLKKKKKKFQTKSISDRKSANYCFGFFISLKKLRKICIPEVTSETETVECVMPQPCVRIPFIRSRLSMMTSPELVSVVAVWMFFFFFLYSYIL